MATISRLVGKFTTPITLQIEPLELVTSAMIDRLKFAPAFIDDGAE